MPAFIGIDLGTTFSAAAAIDETGRPYIVHNKEGCNLTPSCVEFHTDGTHDVGELARRGLFVPGSNALGRFKRSMGSSATYEALGRAYTPTQLSTFVLRRILDDTQAALGTIGEAVVTIPANFAHEAREATLTAARAAGLEVNFIINEPTAAALYYAYKSGETLGGTYAVYDLGGGTFDVSIIRVDGHDVEVLASNGVSRLGGDDFDEALQKIVQAKFQASTGEFLDPEDFTEQL